MNELAMNMMKIDSISKDIANIRDNENKIRNQANYYRGKANGRRTTKKAIIAIACVSVVFISEFLVAGLLSKLGLTNLAGLIMGFSFPIAGAGGALGMYCFSREEKRNSFDDKADDLDKAADTEEQKVRKIMDDNEELLSLLPGEYLYPRATTYIARIVETGRAATVVEALNMFDEQMHRWNIEEQNQEVIDQQKEQTGALKSIKTSSSISAAANVASATANIARLFR